MTAEIPKAVRAAAIAHSEHYAVHECSNHGECTLTTVHDGLVARAPRWWCVTCECFVPENTIVKPDQAAAILVDWAVEQMKVQSQ